MAVKKPKTIKAKENVDLEVQDVVLNNIDVQEEETQVKKEDTENEEGVVLTQEDPTENDVDAEVEPEEPTVSFKSEPTEKVAPERLVKIKPSVNHTCSIGGEYYELKAGKQISVPENVKFILSQSGMLAPL